MAFLYLSHDVIHLTFIFLFGFLQLVQSGLLQHDLLHAFQTGSEYFQNVMLNVDF